MSIKKIAAVGIILVEEDYQTTMLMIRRSSTDPSFPNTWCFPGGKVESNETVEEGLIREIKEETNLDVVSTELFGVYQGDDGWEIHAYLVGAEGTVSLSYEHDDKAFVNLYINSEYNMTGRATYEMIKDLK